MVRRRGGVAGGGVALIQPIRHANRLRTGLRAGYAVAVAVAYWRRCRTGPQNSPSRRSLPERSYLGIDESRRHRQRKTPRPHGAAGRDRRVRHHAQHQERGFRGGARATKKTTNDKRGRRIEGKIRSERRERKTKTKTKKRRRRRKRRGGQ